MSLSTYLLINSKKQNLKTSQYTCVFSFDTWLTIFFINLFPYLRVLSTLLLFSPKPVHIFKHTITHLEVLGFWWVLFFVFFSCLFFGLNLSISYFYLLLTRWVSNCYVAWLRPCPIPWFWELVPPGGGGSGGTSRSHIYCLNSGKFLGPSCHWVVCHLPLISPFKWW